MHCDLVLRNGLVFDGINEGKFFDVAVSDGRICALGRDLDVIASREVDVSGHWITPGFIDIHTHYDLEIELEASLSESVRHGVTSVVMGGCSLSTTFGSPDELADIFSRVETLPPELIARWLEGANEWSSPGEYFAHLNKLPLGPNVASMMGHSALRVKVMGLERSLSDQATQSELSEMRQLAVQALESGCIGISIDMVHWHKVNGLFAGRALPSHHASFEEYAMLADVCRSRDAVFQVTPNPADPLSFLNLLRLSPGLVRAPLRLTILAALDMDTAPFMWRIYSPILFICNQLLGCNIRFQTLAEPFVIYADGHLTPFFEEFSAGVKLNNCKNRLERESLWKQAEFKKEFELSWNSRAARAFHRDFERMTIVDAPNKTLRDKTIAAAAREVGLEPLQYFMKLLETYDEQLRWKACNANSRPNIRQRLMALPHVFPGFSDAGAHSRNLAFFDNSLSVLRQAATTKFLPMHKAVARVTSEPAAWFNLDTGYIKVGARADLTVLNPVNLEEPVPPASVIKDDVFDGASRMVKRDQQLPAVSKVFIGGTEVVRDGNPLPALFSHRHGKVLLQVNPAISARQALERYRNRISDGVLPGAIQFATTQSVSSINSYWTIFVLKHQHPANIAFHCVAFTLMYAIALYALAAKNVWIILLMPLSQTVGLIGHWLFERSPIDQRDTLFSWRAFISLHRMYFCVLCGIYSAEIRSARVELDQAVSRVELDRAVSRAELDQAASRAASFDFVTPSKR